jgi:phospholipid-binding lipoprotein MlaA
LDRDRNGLARWILVAFLIYGVAGCANTPDHGIGLVASTLSLEPTLDSFVDESAQAPEVLSPASSIGLEKAPIGVAGAGPAPDKKPKENPQPQKPGRKTEAIEEVEEPYDPFQTEEDRRAASAEEYDPWEPYNSAMFEFNRKVDKYLLKPVATAYDKVMPDAAQRGIRNFFHNVRFVPRLMNNLFQGKIRGAGLEMGRFLVNSTLGVAGFMDFAYDVFGMQTPDEDLGQTLGVYGFKPGPYLILPFLPPFTLRDVIGYAGDIFLDPINYLVFPSIEIDGAPSLIPHTERWTTFFAQFGTRVGEIVNERALNLEAFQGVEEATIDLYGSVRNAYLQRRARQIRE